MMLHTAEVLCGHLNAPTTGLARLSVRLSVSRSHMNE